MSPAALLRAMRERAQDMADGLCVALMGGLLAALAYSPHYWFFLNPRFQPLTLAAGLLLALVGLALVLRPLPGRATTGRLLRQAVFLGFLTLAAYAWEQAAAAPDLLEPSAGGGLGSYTQQQEPGAEAPADPLPVRGGARYVRLNLAELYIMVDKGRTDYPERFALRARAAAPAGLPGGWAVLTRTAVVCCLADSMELGFLATGLATALSRGLDTTPPGEWVEVFARLEPLGPEGQEAIKAVPDGQGLAIKAMNPKFRVVVEHAEPTAPPGFPYLFEFREEPPFAW